MTAKEYLSRGFRLNDAIDSRLREIDRLRDFAKKVTAEPQDKTIVSGGEKGKSRIEEAVVRIYDLERELDEEIDAYVDIIREITAAIGKVENERERFVLRERYVNFLRWEEIAGIMGYSVRGVFKLHGRALESVRRILADGEKTPQNDL